MPQTLLLAELEMDEYSVDLESLSQLILSDLGATLRIFRAGERGGSRADELPYRMTNCIAELGLQACREALSAPYPGSLISVKVAALWGHSREIACRARRIAEEREEVNPESAYLVGLCHAIGELPSILKWEGKKRGAEDRRREGFTPVVDASLPVCVREYLGELQGLRSKGHWTDLVASAHRGLDGYSAICSSELDNPLMLQQAV